MTPAEIQTRISEHDQWLLEMRELLQSITRVQAETNAAADKNTLAIAETNVAADKNTLAIAETLAIANSNARAIEATSNEGAEIKKNLAELVGIVASFVQATNTRLARLE
jgi:hypothetical protein